MNRKSRIWAVLTAIGLVIAACGGSEGDGGEAVDCELDQVDGDISFYNWSEYIDPELVTAFQEEYGVAVTSDYYESNEAMLAQLQSGAVYDMVVPSDYMIGIMIQEELLLPINTDAVPNLENLGERFRDLPYDPGPGYSAAYQYGTTGLGVNTELVGTDFESSWSLIFDPQMTANYAGGVSVLNDPREAMGAALMYLGYELNDTDIEHLEEARDVIIAAKDGIATFDSDQYDEALVNGEVAVSHGYSGNMIVGIGESDNPDQFQYVLPQEGATFWIDNMAIPTTAESPCTAFTFMNYLLDAENGATLTNWNYYGSPNQTAIDDGLIDQEVVDFYAATETAEDLQIIEDTGDYEINFTDYFAEAKS